MNILAIESASTVCGASIFLESKLVELDEIDEICPLFRGIHAERLEMLSDIHSIMSIVGVGFVLEHSLELELCEMEEAREKKKLSIYVDTICGARIC